MAFVVHDSIKFKKTKLSDPRILDPHLELLAFINDQRGKELADQYITKCITNYGVINKDTRVTPDRRLTHNRHPTSLWWASPHCFHLVEN